MSGDTFALVWRTPWPSVYHFSVAMVIARYQDRFGVCRLKQKTVARMLGCSQRQVAKVLQDMRDTTPPQIKIVETRRQDGSQGTNLVQLTLEAHVRSWDDPLVTADDFYLEYGSEQTAQPASGKDAMRRPGPSQRAHEVPNTVRSTKELDSLKASSEQQDSGAIAALALNAFEAWNLTALSVGLPVAEKLTEGRRKKLNKRIQESGIEGWARALKMIECSRFLCGEVKGKDGGAPFRASIDFLLQPSSFQKVVEGGYGQDRKPTVAPADASKAYQERLRTDERFARTMAHQWTQDPDRWPPEAGPPPGQQGCVLPVEVQANVVDRMRTATHAGDALAYALAPSIGIDLGREHQPDDEVPL